MTAASHITDEQAERAARRAAYQRERVEIVALALCELDGRQPEGIVWGAACCEAFRFIAAFDALARHAEITAAYVAAPAGEQTN